MAKKVLIIEDEHYLLELTESVLKKRGYEIISLDNGAEALDYAVRNQPNIIILDNFLPDKNGVDICVDIKSNPSTRSIPVILTTGHVMEKQAKKISPFLEPDFILWKPFDIDQLCDKIQELIR